MDKAMTGVEFKAQWLPLQDGLFRVASYLLGNEDDASDAVQDLYVKLWNRRDSLVGVRNYKSYAIRLMRNLCLDRLRHGKVLRSVELDEANVEEDGKLSDAAIITRETLDRLNVAIRELSGNQRDVLTMRVFKKMEYSDISKVMKMPETTLRVLLHEARKSLRERVGYKK